MDIPTFWNEVEQEIARYDLLQHPFYQAWSAGTLTRQDLKFYAQQYYDHVSAFPTYLAALHSRLPEGPMRRAVLANAFDEECAGVPHSELWVRFLEAMGGDCSMETEKTPVPETSELVSMFRAFAGGAPVAMAFGALYAYESQVPRIAAQKEDGLKRFYGADDRACGYFVLHIEADVHHSKVWREMISTLIRQDQRHADHALAGVSRAARALWSALDGIDRERKQLVCAG